MKGFDHQCFLTCQLLCTFTLSATSFRAQTCWITEHWGPCVSVHPSAPPAGLEEQMQPRGKYSELRSVSRTLQEGWWHFKAVPFKVSDHMYQSLFHIFNTFVFLLEVQLPTVVVESVRLKYIYYIDINFPNMSSYDTLLNPCFLKKTEMKLSVYNANAWFSRSSFQLLLWKYNCFSSLMIIPLQNK